MDLEIFEKLQLELIGIKQITLKSHQKDGFQPELQKLISSNLNIASKFTRRKPQYSHFCQNLSKRIIQQEFLICFYRLQDEEYENLNKDKFQEALLKAPIMQNSNKTFPEHNIISQGNLQKTEQDIPTEFFEILFLETPLQLLTEISLNLKIKLYDNTNLENSFIFDLPPPEQIHTPIATLMIISPYIVDSVLTKSFIIKKAENEDFEIQLFTKKHLSETLRETVTNSYA